jgi:hypothetical protein
LFAIGATLPDFNESTNWLAFTAARIQTEMGKQVLPDGVNYEGTIAYHRFVIEIFTLFYVISSRAGIDISASFSERLVAMFDFVRFYIKPDGSAPSVGDSDDGRLLRFKTREPLDHSYLMSLAAVLFEDGRFRQSVTVDEEAIWWLGPNTQQRFEALPLSKEQPGSKAFDDAQIFVQRAGQSYAIIDCGDHGARGHGSHGHSDALSIELFANGRTFLRDPGTFVYTANESLRNQFRSTAYHNTVRIDGRDISLIREGEPFVLGPNVRPTIHLWESTEEKDILDASHDGYISLDEPVRHRRVITFNKRQVQWLIKEIFSGSGKHLFEFFFNLDSGLEVELNGAGKTSILAKESRLEIFPLTELPFEIEIADRWVSPSYGVRVPSSAIIYRLRREVPFECEFLVLPHFDRKI